MTIDPRTLGFNELVDALTFPDAGDRRMAAIALGTRRTRRAVPPLIATLKDKDPAVRQAAAVSLGLLQDPHAIEPLLRTLKDWNPRVRNQAASALAMIDDPRAVDAMIFTLVRDPEMNVRNMAILALQMSEYTGRELSTAELEISDARGYGRLADAFEVFIKHRSIRDLIRIMQDSGLEPYVRSRAAFGLGLICDREALEPLREAAKNESADLAGQAHQALERIKKLYITGKEPAFSLKNVLGAELIGDEDITEVTGREPARAVVRKGMQLLRSLGKRFWGGSQTED